MMWHTYGWASYVRGDLGGAQRYLALGLQAVRRHDTAVRATLLSVSGMVARDLGRRRDALALLRQSHNLISRTKGRYVFDDYLVSELIRTYTALGEYSSATMQLAGPPDPRDPILISVANAELLIARRKPERAESLLRESIEYGRGLVDEILQAMVLLAHLLTRFDPKSREGVSLFTEAMSIAAPESVVQPFLRYSRATATFIGIRGVSSAHPVFADTLRVLTGQHEGARGHIAEHEAEESLDGFTRREREVLCLLDERLTTAELAEMMHVSVNTLKTHLRNICRKLGVTTRRAAVVEARQRGIIL